MKHEITFTDAKMQVIARPFAFHPNDAKSVEREIARSLQKHSHGNAGAVPPSNLCQEGAAGAAQSREAERRTNNINRALDYLRENPGQMFSDVGKAIGCSRSTAHLWLVDAERRGLVRKEKRISDGTYKSFYSVSND